MDYKPKTNLEIFGNLVCGLLVENFPKTFLVGGTVRDILLKRPVKDIDIATSARPEQAAEILKNHFIDFNLGFKNLGIVVAKKDSFTATVATLRKEQYSDSRYPKIVFVNDPKTDSQRRDFTINALYLSAKTGKILDFYTGIKDLKTKKIRFVGEPLKKISQDPLRIIRALRFALELGFKIEKQSFLAIKKSFAAVNQLSKSRLETEVLKLKNLKKQNLLRGALQAEKNLDKYFKSR